MSEATKVPSILSALIERLSDGNADNPILGAIKGIGATLASVGMTASTPPGLSDASTGQLNLADLTLPKAIASGQAFELVG